MLELDLDNLTASTFFSQCDEQQAEESVMVNAQLSPIVQGDLVRFKIDNRAVAAAKICHVAFLGIGKTFDSGWSVISYKLDTFVDLRQGLI